jgi:WD40 repeat protein
VTIVSEDGKLACIYRDAPSAEAKIRLQTTWEGTEYDLETGKERRKFGLNFTQRRAGQSLNAAWMSSDGKLSAALVVTDVAVWNTEKGEFTQKILRENGEVFWTMVVSSDEKMLIVSDNGGLLHVHDMATGKRLRSFGVAGDSPIRHMSISPDGKLLVTAGEDSGLLRVWNFAKGTEEMTLKCPDAGNVVSLAFSADSQIIVSGSLTGFPGGPKPLAVRTWNAATGKPVRDWTGDPWRLGSYVAVSPIGKVLATMNFFGVITFWNMETGQALPAAAASPCGLEGVAFLADGKSLFTLGRDYEIRKWDAATGQLVGTQLKLREENKVEIFASDKLVVRASRDSVKLDVMDTTTGDLLLTAEGDEICLTPDNKKMATGSKDLIRVYDLQAAKLIHSWKVSQGLFAADGSAPVLRGITPDGRSVVLHSNKVAFCDAATGEVKSAWSLKDSHIFDGLDETPKFPKSGAKAKAKAKAKAENLKSEPKTLPNAAVSQDGNKIALLVIKSSSVAGGFGHYRLTVHETATGRILHKAEVPEDGGRPVLSFSPDGKLLAWGGHFKVYVWQIGNEKPAWVLDGHRSFVKSLSFSRDSARLASASWDSTALIWDLKHAGQ